MKPGEFYTKTEYGSTYITLVTEVNEELNRYSYIDIYFDTETSYVSRADSASTYCGPLDTSGWIDSKSITSDVWRQIVLTELERHHFDTNFVKELWRTLDAEPNVKPGTIYVRDELLYCFEKDGKLYLAPDMSDPDEDYNYVHSNSHWREASTDESKTFCKEAILDIEDKIQNLNTRLANVRATLHKLQTRTKRNNDHRKRG